MDEKKLPKRYILRNGILVEKKESPEVTKKLCRVDTGRLFLEFGGDKAAARRYVREQTGANVITAYQFVRKAYRTLGRGYDESLPESCSCEFLKDIGLLLCRKTQKNAPFFRYTEIICQDERIRVAAECRLVRQRVMRLEKHKSGKAWKYVYKGKYSGNCYWDEEGYVFDGMMQDDVISVNENAVFVLTDKAVYLVARGTDACHNDIFLGHRILLDDIEGMFFVTMGNDLEISAMPERREDSVSIVIDGQARYERKVFSEFCSVLNLKAGRGDEDFRRYMREDARTMQQEEEAVGFLWEKGIPPAERRDIFINDIYEWRLSKSRRGTVNERTAYILRKYLEDEDSELWE